MLVQPGALRDVWRQDLNTLAALGEWLVDMHGPHEHQSLLQPARQLAILDAFGKLELMGRGLMPVWKKLIVGRPQIVVMAVREELIGPVETRGRRTQQAGRHGLRVSRDGAVSGCLSK